MRLIAVFASFYSRLLLLLESKWELEDGRQLSLLGAQSRQSRKINA